MCTSSCMAMILRVHTVKPLAISSVYLYHSYLLNGKDINRMIIVFVTYCEIKH
jgi:hypothetical protein